MAGSLQLQPRRLGGRSWIDMGVCTLGLSGHRVLPFYRLVDKDVYV